MVQTMGEAVKAFVGGAEQSDDLTMLAIRYRGMSHRGPDTFHKFATLYLIDVETKHAPLV